MIIEFSFLIKVFIFLVVVELLLLVFNFVINSKYNLLSERAENISFGSTLVLLCFIIVSIVSLYFIEVNMVDKGFVSGISQNMYLEGARLQAGKLGWKEIQPNGIELVIHQVDVNKGQNAVLENDTGNVLLKNCVRELDLDFMTVRGYYNILYLEPLKYNELYEVYSLDKSLVDMDLTPTVSVDVENSSTLSDAE